MPKSVQHLADVLFMLEWVLGIDQDIINVVEGARGQGVLAFKLDIMIGPWTVGREFIGFDLGEDIAVRGLEIGG